MVHNYWQLKHAVGVSSSPLLSAFEQYCKDMATNTRVLEWSCKITNQGIEAARFLHTAQFAEFSKARYAIHQLYSTLFNEPGSQELDTKLFNYFRSLAERVGQGIALGYAEQGTSNCRRSEIKLYVATSRVDAVRPLIELLVPQGAIPPVKRVMIAATLDEARACSTRVYYLWERSRFDDPTLLHWLDTWCTREEARLINSSSSNTVSIAFKRGVRDMLYLSTPFNHSDIDSFVAEKLQPYPIAYNQLDNLRWIGFSKGGEALDSQELNVYFNSVY